MCLKYLHLDEWGRVFAPPAGFLKTYYTFILLNRCVSELRDLRKGWFYTLFFPPWVLNLLKQVEVQLNWNEQAFTQSCKFIP